jgi:hypothetical protein
MGDFTCFRLYFEVKAFKRLAKSFAIGALNEIFQKNSTIVSRYLLKRR